MRFAIEPVVVVSHKVIKKLAYVASPLSAATNGALLRAEGGLVTTIA
ncbi:MAG: hypothetical protein JWM33_1443 [Caulobacteraceae bacterium]|nr:hypothetical protein [Caulobacteraceae bacterium]